MGETLNVAGRWIGYYRQHGRERPITAEFVQNGESLTGVMTDGETDSEQSLAHAAIENGWPPGADEQVYLWLRQQCREAERLPIRVVTQLPSSSLLEGTVHEQNVHFSKTYQGRSFSGYLVGERRIGQFSEGHVVQYFGRVRQDGNTMEGKWLIPAQEPTQRTAEGTFVLRRESAAEEVAVAASQARAELGHSWV